MIDDKTPDYSKPNTYLDHVICLSTAVIHWLVVSLGFKPSDLRFSNLLSR